MSKKVLLTIDDKTAEVLAQRKIQTGTPITEDIRRAIRTRIEQENPKPAETK